MLHTAAWEISVKTLISTADSKEKQSRTFLSFQHLLMHVLAQRVKITLAMTLNFLCVTYNFCHSRKPPNNFRYLFLQLKLRDAYAPFTVKIVQMLILKGCNRSISYVTIFFQHEKQCDETNESSFQTCCKNPNFRQVVLNFWARL